MRKEYRVTLLSNGVITVYEGDAARKIARELLPEEKSGGEVKGIIAYPGVVRGKVVVIESVLDKDKFKKGDILVTQDGSAEFTLFLQLAGAIVTEQGGMISHAAIVARELKTPCIVGTRNATKILKDGDMVEVDADKGIVKIVERL